MAGPIAFLVPDPIQKFMRHVSKDVSGCWLWIGVIHKYGYGKYCGKSAHRLSWLYFRGEIPEGMSICHHCDVRNCVNPDHLFVGTQGDNVRDAWAKGRHFQVRNHYELKTHCKNGHEFTKENTYLEEGKYRKCMECRREKNRRYEERVKRGGTNRVLST
jgi:hypothetical protein